MKQLGFKSNVFLAPMAGITDKPMRQLVSSFGTGVMVSEMVAINAIQRKNPKSYHIADVRDEAYQVVVQLVGGDAAMFADVVKLIEDLGAYSIDAGYAIRRGNHPDCRQKYQIDDKRQIPQRMGSPA